jgi:endonuclease/exonuclease/phosphatase family metal-dependent hydrolase
MMQNFERRIGRRAAIVSCLALLLGSVGACHRTRWETPIKVMTQNVYYGFDVDPLLSATDPADIPVLAAQAFAQLNATNFPERAAAMADEIARKGPDLIALQEVALIRIQSPGDAIAGGTVPADTVYLDYLQVLMSALAARGLDYQIAGKNQNVDVELPMLVGTSPLAFDDIRLTDFDVVLARSDVAVSNVTTATYATKLVLANLGLDVPRGYVAIDATLRNHVSCRFVTTHLEDSPFPGIQLAQAQELVAALATGTQTVILAGDFNSEATTGATYQYLASQGFADSWLRNEEAGKGAGPTWGHDPDLQNDADALTLRIDLIFTRDGAYFADGVLAEVWGDDLDEQTSGGLWPSDHAGVIAELWFGRAK